MLILTSLQKNVMMKNDEKKVFISDRDKNVFFGFINMEEGKFPKLSEDDLTIKVFDCQKVLKDFKTEDECNDFMLEASKDKFGIPLGNSEPIRKIKVLTIILCQQ